MPSWLSTQIDRLFPEALLHLDIARPDRLAPLLRFSGDELARRRPAATSARRGEKPLHGGGILRRTNRADLLLRLSRGGCTRRRRQ